jgi:hypothetical protein
MDTAKVVIDNGAAFPAKVRGGYEIRRSTDYGQRSYRAAADQPSDSRGNECCYRALSTAQRACDEINARGMGPSYFTSYCNHAHRLKDGKPINHECRILPRAALIAERIGDTPRATELIANARTRVMRYGVKE